MCWAIGKGALPIATSEQLVTTLESSGDAQLVTTVFQRWRDDPADFLFKLASACQAGRKHVASVAALRFAEEGRAVPDGLVDLLEVDAGSGALSWVQQDVANIPKAHRDDAAFIDRAVNSQKVPAFGFPQGGAFFAALRTLSALQRRALPQRVLARKHGKAKVALLLHLFTDAER